MNDNIKNLWNTLRSRGFNPPELNQFAQDMQNEENLKKVHKTLRDEGFTPPEFGAFKVDILGKQNTAAEQPASAAQPIAANAMMSQSPITGQQARKLTPPAEVKRGDGSMLMGAQPILQRGGLKHEEKENLFDDHAFFNHERTHDENGQVVLTPKPEDTYGFVDGKVTKVYNDMLTGKTYDANDPSTEQIVKRNTVTYDPNEYVESITKQQLGNLEKLIDNSLSFYAKEPSYGAKTLTDPNSTGFQKFGAAMAMSTPSDMGNNMMSDVANQMANAPSLNYQLVASAKRSLDDAKALIAEAEKSKREGGFENFVAGAGRGFGNKLFDVRTWDMGITELGDAILLSDALKKADKGEQLTEPEQMLLDAKATEMAVQAYFGSYIGAGYKAGGVTAEAIPFMVEMAINPASAAGESVQAYLTRYALKRFGKKAIKDNAKKYVAAKAAARVGGDLVGSAAMAATTGQVAVAADAMERMNGDVMFDIDKNTGRIVYDGHTEGEDALTAYFKAFGARTIENHSEMVGEYFSPVFGAMMKPVGKAVRKGMEKMHLGGVADWVAGISERDWAKKVAAFEQKTKWSGVGAEYVEEVLGNVENALVVGDMTLDDAEGTGVFNLDQNIETFIGVSLMGGVMSGAKTLGYRGQKHEARKEMTRADDMAAAEFKNPLKWGAIRNTVAFGNEEEVKAAVDEALKDGNLTPMQRKLMLDYVKAAEKYKGMLMAEEKNRSVESNAVQTDASTSYDNGYTLPDGQKNDAKNMYEYQRQQATEKLGEDVVAQLDADPIGALTGIVDPHSIVKAGYEFDEEGERKVVLQELEDGRLVIANANEEHPTHVSIVDRTKLTDKIPDSPFDAEQKKLARDYVNAKATYDGVIDRVRDDIDTQSAASDAAVDRLVNKQSGMIQGGILSQGKRRVYVIDGDVVLDEEGRIDAASSSESMLVLDPNVGEPEWVSPMDFESFDAPVDPNEEKDAARVAIGEEIAEAQANIIDGTVSPTPGTALSIMDEQGATHQAEIVQDNGDGTVLASIDGGEAAPVPLEVLQEMSDRESLARMEQFLQEQAVMDAEEATDADASGTIAAGETDADASGTVAETPDGEALGTVTSEAVEPMPMIGKGEDAEPDFGATTSKRGHDYIFNESGLEESDATAFVDNNLSAANKELEKVSGKKPKMGTSISKFNKDMAAWNAQVQEAQEKARYWKEVKAEREKVLAKRLDEQNERERLAIEQAQQAEAAYRAEQEAKAAEQAQLGTNTVAPAIRDKWNAAPKEVGMHDEIVLPNGEKITGRYYLVESGAASASHNSTNGFTKTEGFPVDENGGSVNDRDYERDKEAQQVTRTIADNYDSRAVQTPVVVSQDGVVLSGNGRTMAGELAAAQGTDGSYNEYAASHAGRWGFTPEQVQKKQHPRIVFVPDEQIPYTAETFAKFNQQEMKSQSKTEQAVKLGKVVSDDAFNRIIRGINQFDTLGDFYADPKAAAEAIAELQREGVLTQAQMAEMFDGDGISAVGKELLENMLIGKAFESNPDAVREISEFKSMRQSIITALAEISNNLALGEYSLEQELAQAIDLVYQARKNGSKHGEAVSWFARQQNLDFFGMQDTVADYTNATMLMIADVINDSRSSRLKKYLQIYNTNAQDAANGQMDLFSGDVKAKEDIINEVKQLFNYGTEEEQQAAAQAAVERRKADSVQQDGVVGDGDGASESGLVGKYSLSDKKAANGEQFIQDSNGEIDLVDIPQEVFDVIGYTKAPLRLTMSMLKHMISSHTKETNVKTANEAIDFILDVMRNFDHIRLGNNGALVFSVENGRKKTGKRAISVLLSSETGEFYGIVSSGFEGVERLQKRALLWDGSAIITPTTDAASANVPTLDAHESGEQSGSASNQGKTLSGGKGTQSSETSKGKSEENVADTQKIAVQGENAKANTSGEVAAGGVETPAADPTSLNLGGEEYAVGDIEDTVKEHVQRIIEEGGFDAEIVGVKVIGSYMRGEQRADSDLDVLVEYKGKAKEDALFDALAEEGLDMNGVKVDINPITKGKSGTIDEFMKRNGGFSKTDGETSGTVAEPNEDAETTTANNREAWERVKQGYTNPNAIILMKDGAGKFITFGADARKVAKDLGMQVEDGVLRISMKDYLKLKDMHHGESYDIKQEHWSDWRDYPESKKDGVWDSGKYTSKNIMQALQNHPELKRERDAIKNAKTAEERKDAIEDYVQTLNDMLDGEREDIVVAKGARPAIIEAISEANEIADGEGSVSFAIDSWAPKEKRQPKKSNAKASKQKEQNARQKTQKEWQETAPSDEFIVNTVYDNLQKSDASTGEYYEFDNQELARAVKRGEDGAIKEAARRMSLQFLFEPEEIEEPSSKIKPRSESIKKQEAEHYLLVPIPSHEGKATYTLKLAKEISKLTGIPVADVMTGKKRESLYDMKARGERAVEEDLGFAISDTTPFDGRVVLLIDNVEDTGLTMNAAGNALAFSVDNPTTIISMPFVKDSSEIFKIGGKDVFLSGDEAATVRKQRFNLPKAHRLRDVGWYASEGKSNAWLDGYNSGKFDAEEINSPEEIPDWLEQFANHEGFEDLYGSIDEYEDPQVLWDMLDGRVQAVRDKLASLTGSTEPWENVQRATVHTSNMRKRFPQLHESAKSGDVKDAYELVGRVVDEKKIAALKSQHPDAAVVYPHAEKTSGRNAIPAAFADRFAAAGFEVDSGIVQINRVYRTDANKFDRLLRRARFAGKVEAGREYILIDDHVTSGATMRDLKDYIESEGGKVVAIQALEGSAGATNIAITDEQKQELTKQGVTNEQLRKLGISRSVENLTAGEAKELISLSQRGRDFRTPEQQKISSRGNAKNQRRAKQEDTRTEGSRTDSEGERIEAEKQRFAELFGLEQSEQQQEEAESVEVYETKDGNEVRFESLLDEQPSGTEEREEPKTAELSEKRNPLNWGLPKLKEGEMCLVERKYEESGSFNFFAKEKIESADDVAYMFRSLEDSAIEHGFLVVLDKAGHPTILHVGMGIMNGSEFDAIAALPAFSNMNVGKVIMVHNHPSGTLKPSKADRDLHKELHKLYGDKLADGVIIDQRSGNYSTFNWHTSLDGVVVERPTENAGDVKHRVFTFSKQVFSPDYKFNENQLTTPEDMAAFLSAHRLGYSEKAGMLLLNNNLKVVGNIALPNGATLEEIAEAAKRNAPKMTARGIVIYGSKKYTSAQVKKLKGFIDPTIKVFDIFHINGLSDKYESALVSGVLEEQTTYGSGSEFARTSDENMENVTDAQKLATQAVMGVLGENAGLNVVIETQEAGQRAADAADGEMMADDTPVDPFYSNAAKAVEDIKQEKATGEQWLAMIKKNGGLKAEEDKWMGLSDWLAGKKSVTKQEVMQFIAENAVKVQDVNYSEETNEYSENDIAGSDEFTALVEELTEYDDDGEPYISRERFNEYADKDYTFTDAFSIDYWGETLDIDDADAAARYLHIGNDRPIEETRLNYTTEGLENQREIALVVPTIEPYNESDEIHFGDAGEGRAVAWLRFGDATSTREVTDAEREEALAAMPTADKWTKHDGSQFVSKRDIYTPTAEKPSKNFIVHHEGKGFAVEINDRAVALFPTLEEAVNDFNKRMVDAQSKKVKQKVLVIDEVQSKRHQDGRENGYTSKEVLDASNEYNRLQGEASRYSTSLLRKYADQIRTARENGEDVEPSQFYTEEEKGRIRELNEAMWAAQERAASLQAEIGTVPDAPFQKNWHELAMKRALRYAAENGYDVVAWTTGAQQAERYALSRSADGIEIFKSNLSDSLKAGLINLSNGSFITLHYNEEGEVRYVTDEAGTFTDEYGLKGKNLSEIVGKDIAAKMISANKGDRLSGEDLSFGGEGMKGFYDQMLPRFMDKYGKKWGVKTHDVELDLPNSADRVMHAVDVTTEMRESVMKGQPMFQRKGEDDVKDDNEAYNEQLERYSNGEMKTNEYITLGMPNGVLSNFMPSNKIILRQKIVTKAMKKHGLTTEEIKNLPSAIANPIFVFKSSDNSVSVLTEIKANDGNNIFVSIELGVQKQMGHEFLEVNDILTIHGRETENVILPISQNESLKYVDKEKARHWLSSVQTNEQAITKDVLNSAAKVVEDFENPTINEGKSSAKAEFMRVFHGSAATFDHFDSSHFMEGEGSMVYGAGHYVTNVEGTGKMYATIATEKKQRSQEPIVKWKGERIDFSSANPLRMAFDLVQDSRSIKEARERAERYIELAEAPEMKQRWKDALDILNQSTKADFKRSPVRGNRQLYEIEIPDDNGSNYLDWNSDVSEEQAAAIHEALKQKYMEMGYSESEFVKALLNGSTAPFGQYYRTMSQMLGGDKQVSDMLSGIGFTGIKVPTGNRRGGDGRGMNYVIFNDADLDISNRVEFMENGKGTVYGWSEGNTIHLTPEGINPNTPIHEYTHLWAKAVQQKAPELWANIKDLLRGTPEWNRVLEDPAYKNIRGNEDAVASEVLSRISGRENARKMVAEAQKMIDEADGVFEKAEAHSLLHRMQTALKKFWQWVGKNLFDMKKFDSVEEITDRVLYDMVNKTDLQLSEHGDARVEMQVVTDPKVIERLEKSEKITGYRNVVLNPDGTFGSPMASGLRSKGKQKVATASFEMNKWEQSEENPDLADENGKINLVKPDGKTVDSVDYNPYIHNRPNKVNKQFKQAWERPDLVYIRTEIPLVDLESGYHADKAAKSVGVHNWPSKTSKQQLILSRYDKPVEIVPWEDVADDWEQEFKGRGVEFDIIPPKLLPILAERGVEILPPHKGMGEACVKAYEAWKAQREHAGNGGKNNTDITSENFKNWFGDWEKDPEHASKVVDENGEPLVVYHGTGWNPNEEEAGNAVFHSGWFTSVKGRAEGFGEPVAVYLDIKNPIIIDKEQDENGELIPDGFNINDKSTWGEHDGVISYIYYPEVPKISKLEEAQLKRKHPDNYEEKIAEVLANKPRGRQLFSVIPKNASQIKSATNNNGEYSTTNPDIRYRQQEKFEDGQVLPIDYNWEQDGYTVEGLNDAFNNVGTLLERFREKHEDYVATLSEDGESIVVEPWSKYLKPKKARRRSGKPTKQEQKASDYVARKTRNVVEYVKGIADKLHLPKVEVLTSTEGLKGKRATSKGWFEPTTGRIVIVLPNHTSSADVMKTLLHEGVAHYGLRNMFGEDFDTFLDNVFQNATLDVRKKITALAQKNGWDFRTATEEYLAGLAEDIKFDDPSMNSWWNKMKEFFMDMLRKAGFVMNRPLDDNDLRYILIRSYSNLQNEGEHGILREAENVVLKQRFGIEDFANEEGSDAEQVAEDGVLYRDGDDTEADASGTVELERPMTFQESIMQGLMKLAEKHSANAQLKMDVLHAIGGELSKLRKAMSAQKAYDRSTVDNLVGLATLMIKNGYISGMSMREITRTLNIIKNANGKKDISKDARKIVDMLVDNQVREAMNMLARVTNVSGSKVNASGVEVQGQLDVKGQMLQKAFKEAMKLDKEQIAQRMSDVSDRMESENQTIAENAAIEFDALNLALAYVMDITESKAEEARLKREIKDAKNEYNAGSMSKEQYEEYVASLEDAILSNKLERIEAAHALAARVGGVYRSSIEAAKEFRETERERVQNIHHMANSDMQGIPSDEHHKGGFKKAFWNSSIVRFFLKPLGTFEQMLRLLGKKSAEGKGYLYNHFMTKWTDATDSEWKNLKKATDELDAMASKVFGKDMRWSDLYEIEREHGTVTVSFWDGGDMKDHELTQGNLLYMYMVNKMTDGKMKLRRMGVTKEDMEKISELLDPRFKVLADWLQDEFLVKKREDYNKVHERMFGAPMAAIENYFPLRILGDARVQEVDVNSANFEQELQSTLTGAIIKRQRNSTALDITHADAFSVVIEHLQEMEHWAAFAEMTRDLNTLLSYKRFKNQIKNMNTIYGAGDTFWKNFMVTGSMAVGKYHPKVDQDGLDKAVLNIGKGVTAAKISFRLFTAFKQLSSSPAFLADANMIELGKSFAAPWKAWNWAMKELPTFQKRWQSRQAGDSRLMPTDMDWKLWNSNIVETLNRWGMSPNAFVDAITVAIGGRAIYKTKYKQYVGYGYSHEQADKKAKQDAAIAVNATQQSSESAFLSRMQVDRTALNVGLSLFRNASMGYQRQLVDGLRTLKRMMKPGYRSESIAFMEKQMVRDGLTEEEAAHAAKRVYNRSIVRNIAKVGVFGFVMQFAWNLMPYLLYLVAGSDDDEKKKLAEEAATHALLGGWMEGLSGGNIMSELGNMAVKGENIADYNFNLLPLMSDIQTTIKHFSSDPVACANDVVNLLIQMGVGVNPQTLTDDVVAIYDACNGDPKTSKEAAILFARLTSMPQSQIEKVYMDELRMKGDEAKNLTAEQLAERYAKYKRGRGATLTDWMYTDEKKREVETKYIRQFEKKAYDLIKDTGDLELAKEKLSSKDYMRMVKEVYSATGDIELDEAYDAYDEKLKEIGKQVSNMNAEKNLDPISYAEHLNEIVSTPEYSQYRMLQSFQKLINTLIMMAAKATTDDERESYLSQVADLKRQVVMMLDSMQGK